MKPIKKSNSLIQDGLFRWSRNPLYLDFVTILTGIFLLRRSLSAYFPRERTRRVQRFRKIRLWQTRLDLTPKATLGHVVLILEMEGI